MIWVVQIKTSTISSSGFFYRPTCPLNNFWMKRGEWNGTENLRKIRLLYKSTLEVRGKIHKHYTSPCNCCLTKSLPNQFSIPCPNTSRGSPNRRPASALSQLFVVRLLILKFEKIWWKFFGTAKFDLCHELQHAECVTDLDLQSKMIIFESILSTYKLIFF